MEWRIIKLEKLLKNYSYRDNRESLEIKITLNYLINIFCASYYFWTWVLSIPSFRLPGSLRHLYGTVLILLKRSNEKYFYIQLKN